MRIFVAGATGALGRALVPELAARGHDVVGLARSDANAEALRRAGATPARADPFDADALAEAMRGSEVVIRAATAIPTAARPAAADWAANDRVRRDMTRALLAAAKRSGARRFVQESIAWLARPDDGAPFDERSLPNPDAVTASALDAERLAEESGLPAATLRLGWLYGEDTAHTRAFAEMLQRRRLPVVSPGTAPLAWLHAKDAARAFAAAAEAQATGTFHVVDDAPTSIGHFLDAFAAALGAPRPRRIPAWLARLAIGDVAVKHVTTPMRTSSARFTAATGWRPVVPSVAEGARLVARALSEERARAPPARD